MRDYREQVQACWLGKAIGGTLGQPHEGKSGPLELEFYDPVPDGTIPNDDLDLQVVSALALAQQGHTRVHREIIAQAARDHVTFPWDEYGCMLRNLAYGIEPPLSGQYDNWFTDGMGAAIRSELWACLAPGRPEIAAAYAYEDACVDHAGDGVWAAVFHAALQSLAFVESDRDRLLDAALAFLPPESRVRRALEDTRRWWKEIGDWRAVRERILAEHGHPNFTDVAQNLAFTELGWLAGEDDFGKSICIAVNCGMDTDCTGATLAALLGILDPASIPDKWREPIGQDLILSPGIIGLSPPETIEGFTELTLNLARELQKTQTTAELPSVLPRKKPALGEAGVVVPARMWIEESAVSEPQPSAAVEETSLPGHWITDPRLRRGLAMRFEVALQQETAVRVMAATWGRVRAWLDGKQVVSREQTGNMIPSFHRAVPAASAPIQLDPGKHTLTVVARVPEPSAPEIVIGVGQAQTNLWLPWALARRA